jgi:hypothetical protein
MTDAIDPIPPVSAPPRFEPPASRTPEAAPEGAAQRVTPAPPVGNPAFYSTSFAKQYDPLAPDADRWGLVPGAAADIGAESGVQMAGLRFYEANLAVLRTADALARWSLDLES